MGDLIELEIVNWEKYQHHNGKKTYGWFKFSSTMLYDPEIQQLTPSEFKVWVHLMCSCAMVRKSSIKVGVKLVGSTIGVHPRCVSSAIFKLQQFQIVKLISGTQSVPQNRIDKSTIEGKEEKRKETTLSDQGAKAPLAGHQDALLPEFEKPKKKRSKENRGATVPLWEAYKEAYNLRYKVDPVRNATVNGQLGQLLSRLGKEPAIEVLKLYLKHNDSWYLKSAHSVGMCLRDAEKLHTEMQMGRRITSAEVKQADRDDHNAQVFERVLNKQREREVNEI